MGISLSTNFTVNTALPIEDRMLVADLAARNAIPALRRWEGMIVYVISEGMHYTLSGGIVNGNWGEIAGGGGGISNWLTATDYLIGSVIIQNDKIYQSLADHTSGVFATDLANGDWKEISSYEKGIDSWITAKAYKIDDVVINANKIYKALSVHTSGVFDTDLTNALWTEVSKGGGGSGGINYILNPEADTNINGWVRYKNTVSDTPTTGTGGTSTFLFERETSSPLRGAASFLLTKPASDVQGEGFSYDFTIDNADKGKILQGSFDYQIASGTFADDAMTVWIYDITNSRLIQPAPTKLKNSGIIERFPFEFQTSIDSTSYRLIVHQSSTSAIASTIKFDNFKVGPTAKAYGSAVTDWVAYAPTFQGLGTPSAVSARYRRIGDSLEVFFGVSTGTHTGALVTMGLPSGLTLDSTKIINNCVVGSALSYLTPFSVSMAVYASDLTKVFIDAENTSTLLGGSAGTTWANNNTFGGSFLVPIQGWSSSTIMSSDASTRVVAASYVRTTLLSVPTATDTPVIYDSVILDKTSSMNTSNGRYSIPVAGEYTLSASSFWNSGIQVGGTSYQMRAVRRNSSGAVLEDRYLDNYTAASTQTMEISSQITNAMFDCKVGDTLEAVVWQNTGSTRTLGAYLSYVNISRISGPSQIAASESVSALYTGAPPTGTVNGLDNIKFGTKVKDSHGAYNTTTGEYRVPMSGVYTIASEVLIQGVFVPNSVATITLQVDSVPVSGDFIFAVGAASHALVPKVFITSIPLLQGQILTIKANCDGTTPGFNPSSAHNYFSITRTGNY